MRIIQTLKNSIYAIFSYIILLVLALLVRKVFLMELPIELLGYEGLFGNVFALLALADLGIESLILYRMFPSFANDNHNEINKNMAVYKLLYKYIGIAIIFMGIALIPFLKYIVTGNNLDWKYVYTIYFVQLITTLCTYFLAYKRLMFTVSQQEFECTKVDTAVSTLFNLIKIIVLLLFESYILYLLCNLAINLISNIIISIKVDRKFVFFNSGQKATIGDIKQLGMGKEIRDNLVQKVSGTIYGGTDNIVASALLGISCVGLMANYSLIGGYVTNFINKLLRPFQMAIGNHIYSSDKDEGYELFRMFDYISYIIASTVATCYLCLFNPFIELWIGQDFLLCNAFVVAFALNQYVLWNHQFLCYYRYSFGGYELDKYPILVAAIVNVMFSVVLCKPLGIAGIMIGTLVGQLGFWIGRIRVVYSLYIKKETVKKYVFRQMIRLIIFISELYASWIVCGLIPVSVVGVVARLFIAMAVPVLTNIIVFCGTQEMKTIKCYVKKTLNVVKNRVDKL